MKSPLELISVLDDAEWIELNASSADEVWALARSKVMRLGHDEKPFSVYDAGITDETKKRAALAELTALALIEVSLGLAGDLATHHARSAGASFVEMGEAVGITRQAARKRFA